MTLEFWIRYIEVIPYIRGPEDNCCVLHVHLYSSIQKLSCALHEGLTFQPWSIREAHFPPIEYTWSVCPHAHGVLCPTSGINGRELDLLVGVLPFTSLICPPNSEPWVLGGVSKSWSVFSYISSSTGGWCDVKYQQLVSRPWPLW